jgi:hypothetical protein
VVLASTSDWRTPPMQTNVSALTSSGTSNILIVEKEGRKKGTVYVTLEAR